MRKTIKRLVAVSMMAVISANMSSQIARAASGNYIDIYFTMEFNGDGEVASPSAQKLNTTKTNVYNAYSPCDIYVQVMKGSTGVSNYEFCGRKKEIFISTSAKAYDTIYLKISPATIISSSISGYWSPDSINYNRNIK